MAPPIAAAETALSLMAERLRAAREQAGLTLDELAALTGLSKAHLSRLESGERQPSVAALLTFSGALNVPVGHLLGENGPEPASSLSVYAPGRRSSEVDGLAVVPSSGFPGSGALEALRMRISPQRRPGPPARHRGEEWVYVIKGTLRLEYNGSHVLVGRDSCAHFDAELPHRLAADGGICEALVVAAQGRAAFWNAHK